MVVVSTTKGDDMPSDRDPDTEATIESAATASTDAGGTNATGPVVPSRRRSVLRGARRLATPAAIVVAWIVVVTQWNASDTALFNWATITAAIVLGVVTVLWLVSLRFPALRRALLPFEGGLVVGALVLAWATKGTEVDMLADRVIISSVFGVIAALLLAFMQQLVAGRDRAWAWLTGVVVVCALAGIALPATLDWLDGDMGELGFDATLAGEVVGRSTADGFRLDDVSIQYGAPALGRGYIDDAAAAYGVAFAEPAAAVDPATEFGSVVPTDAAIASPTDPSIGGPTPPGYIEGEATGTPNWAQLLAHPGGKISLAIAPSIARGARGTVVASLRRGDCGDAYDGDELATLTLHRSSGAKVDEELSLRVKDLRVDDRLSVVIGTTEPLAPTRCAQLLSPTGVALAQLGAASFSAECLDPLDLPRGSEYMVRSSTFQDEACASRFERYATVTNALLVPGPGVAEYRACHRSHEASVNVTEQRLPHGAIAVTYPANAFGQCWSHGTASLAGVGYASTGVAVGPAPAPMPDDVAVADPGVGAAPAVGSTVPPGPGSASPAAAAAPAVAQPATDGSVAEDLDGVSPQELAVKIR
ncbi:MAG: hypothetical protein JWL76_2346 [Thermoleophilia bacterium]|nr:hypothetical protein [Thermoleophilia bacterium]